MSVRWLSGRSSGIRPKVLRHAGLRWEVLPGGEQVVLSRDDWTSAGLRDAFGEAIVREKGDERFVFRMPVPGGEAAVKVQRSQRLQAKLRSLYGWCKARKEWEHHLAAFAAGLPTVRPLALGERWRHLVVQEAVVIVEWRQGAVTVSDWRKDHPGSEDGDTALGLAAALGRVAALAHAKGIFHNEMYVGNVLVENLGADPRLVVIDWKHARLKQRTAANDAENLVQIAWGFDYGAFFAPPTPTERRAFLRAYLEASADRPGRAEVLARLRRTCPDASWIDEEFDALVRSSRPASSHD